MKRHHSTSRVRVHNKTLKYCPVFPGTFASLDDARVFSGTFFTYYNTEHRHSGIGLHTPATVHDGTAWTIRARRQQVLDDAFAARPDRFRRPPQAPRPARQGMDQQAPAHHRDAGDTWDKSSRLMSQSV